MSSWIFNVAVVGSLAYLYAADGDLEVFKEKVSSDAKRVVEQVQEWKQEQHAAVDYQQLHQQVAATPEVAQRRSEILQNQSASDPAVEESFAVQMDLDEGISEVDAHALAQADENSLAGLMSSGERRQALHQLAEEMEMRYLQRGDF